MWIALVILCIIGLAYAWQDVRAGSTERTGYVGLPLLGWVCAAMFP